MTRVVRFVPDARLTTPGCLALLDAWYTLAREAVRTASLGYREQAREHARTCRLLIEVHATPTERLTIPDVRQRFPMVA
jgi:hypothetical protein